MKILICRIPAYFGVKHEHPENTMLPMELAYITAIALKKGFDVKVLDLESSPITEKELYNEVHGDYDYIVVRAKTPSLEVFKRNFSNTKGKVIGVGHLFTTRPEDIFSLLNLNLLCTIHGEADFPFMKLVDSLVEGRGLSEVPNISYRDENGNIVKNKEELLDNLDDLPIPAYELFYKDNFYYTFYPVPIGVKKNYGFMMTSRGCPYSCSFCSPTLRNSFGKKMRFHSIDRIIEDLKYQKSLGKSIIFFRDDIFTVNRKFTIALCERLIEENIGLKWCAQTHINNIDKELLDIISKAGCVSLGFGLESGSQKILNNLLKTNKIDEAPELVRYAKKKGIKTVCFFLVGSPGENLEDQKATVKLLKQSMPSLIQVAFFTPYPGSYDYERYVENKNNYDFNLHHYNGYNINYTDVSNSEVVKFQKSLYRTRFFTPSTITFLSLSLLSDLTLNFSYFKIFFSKGLMFFKNIFISRKTS